MMRHFDLAIKHKEIQNSPSEPSGVKTFGEELKAEAPMLYGPSHFVDKAYNHAEQSPHFSCSIKADYYCTAD